MEILGYLDYQVQRWVNINDCYMLYLHFKGRFLTSKANVRTSKICIISVSRFVNSIGLVWQKTRFLWKPTTLGFLHLVIKSNSVCLGMPSYLECVGPWTSVCKLQLTNGLITVHQTDCFLTAHISEGSRCMKGV